MNIYVLRTKLVQDRGRSRNQRSYSNNKNTVVQGKDSVVILGKFEGKITSTHPFNHPRTLLPHIQFKSNQKLYFTSNFKK